MQTTGTETTTSELKKAKTVEMALYRDVKNAETAEEPKESQPKCANGVCTVTWKPVKPAA